MLVGQMFLGKERFGFPFIYEFIKTQLKKKWDLFSLFMYFYSYHYNFKIPFTFIYLFFFNIYTCKFPKVLKFTTKILLLTEKGSYSTPQFLLFLYTRGSCLSSEPKLRNSHSYSTGCYENSHIFPED